MDARGGGTHRVVDLDSLARLGVDLLSKCQVNQRVTEERRGGGKKAKSSDGGACCL